MLKFIVILWTPGPIYLVSYRQSKSPIFCPSLDNLELCRFTQSHWRFHASICLAVLPIFNVGNFQKDNSSTQTGAKQRVFDSFIMIKVYRRLLILRCQIWICTDLYVTLPPFLKNLNISDNDLKNSYKVVHLSYEQT